MKLVVLGTNQTKVQDKRGNEYFFSYDTCVAGYDTDLGYWQTTKKFSNTTTKHIKAYLGGAGATLLEQDDIETSLSSF